jgi:hypothetical protein
LSKKIPVLVVDIPLLMMEHEEAAGNGSSFSVAAQQPLEALGKEGSEEEEEEEVKEEVKQSGGCDNEALCISSIIRGATGGDLHSSSMMWWCFVEDSCGALVDMEEE